MRTVKTDQPGRIPRLIRVFFGCTGDFVGFVVLWLIIIVSCSVLRFTSDN